MPFHERRKQTRTTSQRVRFWTRKVVTVSLVSFVAGIVCLSALKGTHAHVVNVPMAKHIFPHIQPVRSVK